MTNTPNYQNNSHISDKFEGDENNEQMIKVMAGCPAQCCSQQCWKETGCSEGKQELIQVTTVGSSDTMEISKFPVPIYQDYEIMPTLWASPGIIVSSKANEQGSSFLYQ